MIAVTAAAPIDGAGIETGGTADTLQRVAEVLPAKMSTPAIVD
jgi:hypothetical protein